MKGYTKLALGLLLISFNVVSFAETTEERLDRLERAFEARQNSQASMLQQLTVLQRELGELRGITEEHAEQLVQILERQRDLYQEIERRLSEDRREPSDVTQRENEFKTPVLDERSAYERGLKLVLEERKYDEAIPEFQRFIRQNPESSYLGNAHYWLGQLFYAQEDYQNAKTHFTNVVQDFPDSSKRADCLLKLGMIALAESNKTKAEAFFNQVQQEYKGSTEAGMAQRQLKELNTR